MSKSIDREVQDKDEAYIASTGKRVERADRFLAVSLFALALAGIIYTFVDTRNIEVNGRAEAKKICKQIEDNYTSIKNQGVNVSNLSKPEDYMVHTNGGTYSCGDLLK